MTSSRSSTSAATVLALGVEAVEAAVVDEAAVLAMALVRGVERKAVEKVVERTVERTVVVKAAGEVALHPPRARANLLQSHRSKRSKELNEKRDMVLILACDSWI